MKEFHEMYNDIDFPKEKFFGELMDRLVEVEAYSQVILSNQAIIIAKMDKGNSGKLEKKLRISVKDTRELLRVKVIERLKN